MADPNVLPLSSDPVLPSATTAAQTLSFERLERGGKIIYRIVVQEDADEADDFLQVFGARHEGVLRLAIWVDAQEFCRAVNAYVAIKTLFRSVALSAQGESEGLRDNCFNRIQLYWDDTRDALHCEFETVEQRSGVLHWTNLTPYFPVPLTSMPVWERSFARGEADAKAAI